MEAFSTELDEVRKSCVRLAVRRGILKFAHAMRDQGLQGAAMMSKADIHKYADHHGHQGDTENLDAAASMSATRRLTHMGGSMMEGGLTKLRHFEEHEFHNMGVQLDNKVTLLNNRMNNLEGLISTKFDQLAGLLERTSGGGGGRSIDEMVVASEQGNR